MNKLSLEQAMQIAIDEAYKGFAFVSPNPRVGCVVLDHQGYLLSTGHHTRFGQPHAEVEALKGLSQEQLQGAHVIVTLEPCAHEGQTPSCAKMLAQMPLAQVTYGLIDPNPLVAGQGAEIIRRAGIQVNEYQGPLKNDLEEACEEFLWNFRHKKTFVALKVAQSLDGKIALKNGESQWITGPESRQRVHELRAQYDAVLVGKKTVLQDNPSLNVRHPAIQKENQVVVLDRSGDVLKNTSELNIFKTHSKDHIHILSSSNLSEALDELYNRGIRSVMVEGGGEIFASFLKENLVQRLHVFMAPVLIGQGMSWTEGFSIPSLEQKIQLKSIKTRPVGRDLHLTARI